MLITITDPYISLLIVGQAVRICVLLSLLCSRVGKHPLQGHDGEQVGGRVCVSGSLQAGGLMLLDSSVLTELKGRHGWPVGYPKEASQMSVPETGVPARVVLLISSDGLHPILPAAHSFCFAWLWEGLPSPVRDSLILVLFSRLISSLRFQVDPLFLHPALHSNRVG